MLIALQYPKRVQRLLVEDIAPKAYPPWFAPIMRAMQELNLDNIKSRKEADELLAIHIDDQNLRAFLLTNLQRVEQSFKWRVHLDALISGGSDISGFPQLELKNNLPTLFIAGGESPYIQIEDHSVITEYFPSANIDIIEGVDHWVHARDPQKFADKVKSFITS
jgi:pimeloyl-ACP methyl ester carboxylesterase